MPQPQAEGSRPTSEVVQQQAEGSVSVLDETNELLYQGLVESLKQSREKAECVRKLDFEEEEDFQKQVEASIAMEKRRKEWEQEDFRYQMQQFRRAAVLQQTAEMGQVTEKVPKGIEQGQASIKQKLQQPETEEGLSGENIVENLLYQAKLTLTASYIRVPGLQATEPVQAIEVSP